MFTLGVFTHWNVLYEVAVNVLLAAGCVLFLYSILRRTFDRRAMLLCATVIVSMIFFSPIQWENWLWGWQIQWFLSVLGLVVAIWSLSTSTASPVRKTILATIAALVATYSLASGFFVWLVCIPLFFSNRDLRRLLPIWIIAAVVSISTYYVGYIDPSYHPSKILFLTHKIEFIHYLIVYISRPVAWDFSVAPLVASVYLGLSMLVLTYTYFKYRTELFTVLLPWLCLALYALLADASTAISRLGLGVEQAYRNRYITLSNLFLIGLCVVTLRVVELSINHQYGAVSVVARAGGTMVIALLVLLVGFNYAHGITQLRDRSEHLAAAKQCASHAETESDPCLLLLYPNQSVVWKRLNYLRSIHWGGL
jgi:hypothetical protein